MKRKITALAFAEKCPCRGAIGFVPRAASLNATEATVSGAAKSFPSDSNDAKPSDPRLTPLLAKK